MEWDNPREERTSHSNAHGTCHRRIAELEACRDDYLRQLEDEIRENQRFREALENLARLGNGEHYGNSDGNVIAQKALEAE
jgi:hypothetical protein